MTNTEKLVSAWEVLQSPKSIVKMFEEKDVKPDDIEKVIGRLYAAQDDFLEKRNEALLEKVSQMLSISGISMEQLVEYQTRPRNAKNGSRSSGSTYTVVAYYQGKAVNRVGLMPRWAVELGWNNREDIPEEYWTPQHKDHVAAQQAAL